MNRDTSKDTRFVWFDPARGYIFRDTEEAPEGRYQPPYVSIYPIPNPVIALAHAAAMRPTMTTKAEWHRLAQAAIKEYDRVVVENFQLKEKVKNFGPKFQWMTDLA